MENPKIIALYLPQFHCIPENDAFWGKGFTDWETVKKAKPLFPGHRQPRVPMDNNYYDLSLKENVKWQASLAKKYGIYGFGVYHYWFNNEKNLLTKPAEIMRDNEDVDINYFLVWDNANWKRSWSNLPGNAWSPIADAGKSSSGQAVLIPYSLGTEEDWRIHYRSVKTHFAKEKYIKINGKPVFVIFNYSAEIDEMCDYWDRLARADGYAGIHFIFKNIEKGLRKKRLVPKSRCIFNYEPIHGGWSKPVGEKIIDRIRIKVLKAAPVARLTILDYDTVWKKIISEAQGKYRSDEIYHGGFVNYDDTPRRKNGRNHN